MPDTPDYSESIQGNVFLPLTASTGNSLLRDADPALFFATDFFAFLLRNKIGDRLAAEAEKAGVAIPNAVADPGGTTDIDPGPFLGEHPEFRYPLLALWRIESLYKYKTVNWGHKKSKWGIAWVLPAMNPQQLQKLIAIFNAAENALFAGCEQGWDPAYTPPGGNLGDQAWKIDLAGIEEIGIDEEEPAKWGRYADSSSGLLYPAWMGLMNVTERRMPPTGRDKFAGGDASIALASSNGAPPVEHFIDVQTQQAPVVVDVAPKTGTVAGGTSIQVSGRLFASGAIVSIGGVPCTGVVVSSPTLLACTTGSSSNAGAYDVVVTNPDGQSGTLAAAFTYV
jgi:hypothetical protein